MLSAVYQLDLDFTDPLFLNSDLTSSSLKTKEFLPPAAL